MTPILRSGGRFSISPRELVSHQAGLARDSGIPDSITNTNSKEVDSAFKLLLRERAADWLTLVNLVPPTEKNSKVDRPIWG